MRNCPLSDETYCRRALPLYKYPMQLAYSQLGPSLPRGTCVQPSWSVSTPCSLRTAILVRLYHVQLAYSHLGPSLPHVPCVHPSLSVSTPCSLRTAIFVRLYLMQLSLLAILVRLYPVQRAYSHLGPSLPYTACEPLTYDVESIDTGTSHEGRYNPVLCKSTILYTEKICKIMSVRSTALQLLRVYVSCIKACCPRMENWWAARRPPFPTTFRFLTRHCPHPSTECLCVFPTHCFAYLLYSSRSGRMCGRCVQTLYQKLQALLNNLVVATPL
jgi:hypothetical protein